MISVWNGRGVRTMRPYNTAEPQQAHTAYHAPETFTGLRMKALLRFLLAAFIVAATVVLVIVTGIVWLLALALVAAKPITEGVLLWEYSNRLIARELPRNQQPQATKTGDTWRIHLKRELPVGDRGTVDMEPDAVDLPVPPSEFVRIVQQMRRTGTSRDKRPAGVSQPLWRKIMAALEDLDGASKGPNGYELADDLDALLRDISRW
ncbi:MAG: hypothetical protein KDE23_24900 [Caldilinea sp.]|nr:hypothetical protein [Caldilinea sp.]